ncbi:hypothetical protein HZS_3442 [Henneguya salminicola]|nr:hypothetical protein HZS_3442 [Henneguya salminicola]
MSVFLKFFLGQTPHFHYISTVIFMSIAFIFGFLLVFKRRLVLTGREKAYDYFPPLISNVAIDPLPRALLETFVFIAILSSFITIKAKYKQLDEFGFNKSKNITMYFIGIFSNLLFPLIFIYDTDTFLIFHNVLTVSSLILFVIYFWYQTFATKYLFYTNLHIFKKLNKIYIMRIITSISSTLIVIFQVSGICKILIKE